ncbi:MAG: NupC/NupG family nucleoside CNT transporter [Planctomycetota bacterium]|jgi:CNT family concentrative nucleoside transporter
MERVASLVGIFALLGICYFFSSSRKSVSWRIVGVGIGMQLYLAAFIVRPAWVPFVLTGASVCCLGMLLFRRQFLGSHSAEDTSLRAFGIVAARALGILGLFTTLIALGVAVGVEWGLSVFLLACVMYAIHRWAPGLLDAARTNLAVVGCVGVVVLIWTETLPGNFVYLALIAMSDVLLWVIGKAGEGAGFVFGNLGDFEFAGFVFAIQVGAIVILFSGLMSVLYYVGMLPWLVGRMAHLLYRGMGVSGAEALSAASNVFIGQTEAPLVVRPYLDRMTKSEVMALMAGGYATIAGSVFGIYVAMLDQAGFARAGPDLIAASVMSAPAAFVFAKLLLPETEEPETRDGAELTTDRLGTNVLDALTGGVTAGVRLAVNIAAMLLVFYALIQMLDAIVGGVASWLPEFLHPVFGDTWSTDVTFKDLYGYVFAAFAWLIGVAPDDCVPVGQLLGTKTFFNEFFAYIDLGQMIETDLISKRSQVLATYALCGFANFMSIGIQIGGLAALAPKRRPDFAAIAFKAMIAGAFACQLTACIVGLIGDF